MKRFVFFFFFLLPFALQLHAKDDLSAIVLGHKGGVEYEIEASGTVTLERGFNVEKGASFSVYQSSF